jgi:hypothetical protein
MAIVTFDGGQSTSATNAQSTTYVAQLVAQQMPAAPDTLIASTLQLVLREFYTKTAAWRQVVGPYQIARGLSNIPYLVNLNPVDQYRQLQHVLDVWVYPSPGGSTSARQFLRPSTRIIVGQDLGPPSTYFMQAPDLMQLYPAPDQVYGRVLYIYGIMLPVINTPQLPNLAITHHLDALMWGTQARMFGMKGKPWADKEMAMEYRKMFQRESLRLRDEANRAYAGTDTPIQFPPFAGGHYSGSQLGVRNSF